MLTDAQRYLKARAERDRRLKNYDVKKYLKKREGCARKLKSYEGLTLKRLKEVLHYDRATDTWTYVELRPNMVVGSASDYQPGGKLFQRHNSATKTMGIDGAQYKEWELRDFYLNATPDQRLIGKIT